MRRYNERPHIDVVIHVVNNFVTFRTVFNVDPRTNGSNLESSEQVVLDGTSKWSCKIQVTGTSGLTVLSCWMEVTVHELTFSEKNISIDCQISDC